MTVFSWSLMLRVGVWDMWEASNLKHIDTLRTFGSLGALKIIEHFCTRIRNIFPGSYILCPFGEDGGLGTRCDSLF